MKYSPVISKPAAIIFFAASISLLSCGTRQPEELNPVKERSPVIDVPTSAPDTLAPANELDAFVLKGHEVLDFRRGDINNDQREDVILVQKAINEEETSDLIDNPASRPLMLLIRQPDGSLKLAARNDKAILCYSCGGIMGDPYQGITIKGNYFSLEHYGGSSWRWSRIVTFKFDAQAQEWYLHRDGGQYYHAANPDSTMEEKIKTPKDFGLVKFTNFNIYSELE